MTSVLPSRITGTARITWVRVESGFHVASRSGEYVGYAERTGDGHFVGFDGQSTPVGHYISLREAQRAVERAPRAAATVSSPKIESALHVAAAMTGFVAVATFAAAVLTLPVM